MNYGIFAATLVGFVLVAACSADELPAAEYIDETDVAESWEKYIKIFGELIDRYGSEKVLGGTSKFLGEVKDESYKLWHGAPLEDAKFDLATVGLDKEGFSKIYAIADIFKGLVGTEQGLYSVRLELFLSTIKSFFGKDLSAFINETPTHHKTLHFFLRHYGQYILVRRLDRLVSDRERFGKKYNTIFDHRISDRSFQTKDAYVKTAPEFNEGALVSVIAHDLAPGYTEEDLINRARKMNLAKDNLDAKLMLKSFEKYRKAMNAAPISLPLPKLLATMCDNFNIYYGKEMEIYTWVRLLSPQSHVPFDSFAKRAELWRVCLPLINKKTHKDVMKNIERSQANESSESPSLSSDASSLSFKRFKNKIFH